jgi:hypothetical protein
MSEERTLPRTILIIIAAIVIPAAVIAAYVWINREPAPYSGKILSVNVYPIHRDYTQPTTTEGIGGQSESYDEILILANVRIQNLSKIPLYLHDMWAVVDLPDQSERSTAVSQADFDNVFVAYPTLKQYQKPSLRRDITIAPGQSVEGMMIFNYQITQSQWQSASAMKISIDFLHQYPLVMRLK